MREPVSLIAWRRLDVTGLELLALRIGNERVRAESSVICMENGGFRLDHAWELTRDWRALSLRVERRAALSSNRVRYVDLGLSAGFEAELQVDELGLVQHYQHLFERV